MVIKLESSKKEGYNPTLRFKDLLENEHLIMSKNFDTPMEGISQYCKNTGGKWYMFSVTLHSYQYPDMKAMKIITVDESQEVTYFDGDNEYEKNGTWIQTQGTILKALNNAEVGEQLKITMAENAKGKKIYHVETVAGAAVTAPPAPENEQSPKETMDEAIKKAYDAGKPLESVVNDIATVYGVTETIVANRWGTL